MSRAGAARVEEGSPRAERRGALLRFFADPPQAIAEAAVALRAADERYGDDAGREIADIEAGHHPLMTLTPSAG